MSAYLYQDELILMKFLQQKEHPGEERNKLQGIANYQQVLSYLSLLRKAQELK
jgi:hypothetical protein